MYALAASSPAYHPASTRVLRVHVASTTAMATALGEWRSTPGAGPGAGVEARCVAWPKVVGVVRSILLVDNAWPDVVHAAAPVVRAHSAITRRGTVTARLIRSSGSPKAR